MTTPEYPPTMSSRLARVGLWMLRGWRIETPYPDEPKAVILAGPHTTNLDGLLLVLLTRSIGSDAKWMVKDTWTKAPIGWLTRPVGAIGVNRKRSTGLVGQMVEQFDERDEFHLLIPPEGTRSYAEHWKTGFYRIALEAGVVVVPAYVDYRSRRGGFGEAYTLTGDRRVDMDHFREFYAEGAEMARHPAKYGPVRLDDETGAGEPAR